MKQYMLGLETSKEVADAALRQNPINEYTPRILDYPTLRVLKAYREGESHLLPVQQVLMLESLSANMPPQALRDLVKGAELLAATHGIKELYFLDGAGGIGAFAEKHGFELLDYRTFRLLL